jgi:hypothetical protein
MQRHYYVTDDLDDLEKVEHELEGNGIATPQMHVLSHDDADVENHHLHEVEAVLKKDVVHSMEMGALVGVVLAALVLCVAYFAGWTESAAGWVPFIFLAVILLGFSTWEGGFKGIQQPHYQFKRFENALRKGKHVFFVDVDPEQESVLDRVLKSHPQLKPAGLGDSTPRWVVQAQKKWTGFVDTMP